jgi:cyclopropane fatty-acyl-phospholipid synthase-like methyltransferase
MDIVQEWTPSEAEVPEDHWSKSPEYLAEKAKAVHPGQGFVAQSNILPGNRAVTTHSQAMANFTVEYVKTEAEQQAELDAAEKAIREDFDKQHTVFEELALDMITNIEKALKEKDA